jgi:hypothetical protein
MLTMPFAALLLTTPLTTAALAQETLEVPEAGYAISDNLDRLPDAVREKRDRLLAAAESGDMDQLEAIFDAEPAAPTVSFGGPDDPIAYLKEYSADGAGLENLAIMAELLESPYAVLDGGDGDFIYIWPSFAAMDGLSDLTPAQLVEAYRLVGVEQFNQLKEYGGWLHWRIYIGPQGDLQAFVAGD